MMNADDIFTALLLYIFIPALTTTVLTLWLERRGFRDRPPLRTREKLRRPR